MGAIAAGDPASHGACMSADRERYQKGVVMNQAVQELLSILDLESIEVNLFRGRSPQDRWQRVFGGQVIGQALVAACRTVDGRDPHSLHCYFLLGGDPRVPIIYEVDRIRDGRSFTTRRVVAIQHGQAIFALTASFHVAEEGLEHATSMPDVPQPDDLPSLYDLEPEVLAQIPEAVRKFMAGNRPIEIRPVDYKHYYARYSSREPAQLPSCVWMRAVDRLPDDAAIHQCVLAFASDMTLLDVSLLPHGRSVIEPTIQSASLDHAMWFHAPFRADEWLLYVQDSPVAVAARGLSRGLIYTQSGRLIASVAQEGLIRRRPDLAQDAAGL